MALIGLSIRKSDRMLQILMWIKIIMFGSVQVHQVISPGLMVSVTVSVLMVLLIQLICMARPGRRVLVMKLKGASSWVRMCLAAVIMMRIIFPRRKYVRL